MRVVEAPPQLSVPTGAVYVTTAPHWPASLLGVRFGGHVIVGASLSLTVTVNEHVARLVQHCYFVVRMSTRIPVCPAVSVIVHGTGVGESITLNVESLGGLHDVEEPGLES
jgi:acyl-CoA thioesterase